MTGWHHRLNGHEFEQALGDGEEQGSLACCSPWDDHIIDAEKTFEKIQHLKKIYKNTINRHNKHSIISIRL